MRNCSQVTGRASLAAFLLLAAVPILVLPGCASGPSMSMVKKNLEEGRLIPAAAVSAPDFLDQYSHYPVASGREAFEVHVDTDRANMPLAGGNMVVQLGIVAEPPTIEPVQLHFLIYAPGGHDSGTNVELGNMIEATRRRVAEMPQESSLTVDWSGPRQKTGQDFPPLQKFKKKVDLEDFLKSYIFHDFRQDIKHHLILVVAGHSELSRRSKQNLIDMGRIFNAKSISVSAVYLGDKPDFAFFEKLSHEAGGLFSVISDDFNFADWIDSEVEYVNAGFFKEIQLEAHFKSGVRITRILSPKSAPDTDRDIKISLPKLRQGQQRVLLAEVYIPEGNAVGSFELVDVSTKYFDVENNRYGRVEKKHSMNYVSDINDAARYQNPIINRSMAILETKRTISAVEQHVYDKRYYQGIALLTGQSRKLKALSGQLNDERLANDAEILDTYAKNLYEFDDKLFQSLKIWKDLGWDVDRFDYEYK